MCLESPLCQSKASPILTHFILLWSQSLFEEWQSFFNISNPIRCSNHNPCLLPWLFCWCWNAIGYSAGKLAVGGTIQAKRPFQIKTILAVALLSEKPVFQLSMIPWSLVTFHVHFRTKCRNLFHIAPLKWAGLYDIIGWVLLMMYQ